MLSFRSLNIILIFFGVVKENTSSLFPSKNENVNLDIKNCKCPETVQIVCGSDGKNYKNECLLWCVQKVTKDNNLKLVSKQPCNLPNEVSNRQIEINCNCPGIEAPVCGADGITYKNECLLSCISQGNVQVVGVGRCNTFQENQVSNCDCPDKEELVCGTNGKTYKNACTLSCRHQGKIKIAGLGPCNNIIWSLTQNNCHCPVTEEPVCGTDGITYNNECMLSCIFEGKVKVAAIGPCNKLEGNQTPNNCNCPDTKETVCGTNGKTYQNACVLSCTFQGKVKVATLGPCNIIQGNQMSNNCNCVDIEEPVCGTNGKTYKNVCMLSCAFQENVKVATLGPCKTIQANQIQNNCNCLDIEEPVCGRNGFTYKNTCLLNCMTQGNVQVAALGYCRPLQGNQISNICNCPDTNDPVCGNNGLTYINACMLICSSQGNIKIAALGPCSNFQINEKSNNCNCPDIEEPICGVNGITYKNACLLFCIFQGNIKAVSLGPCKIVKEKQIPNYCNCADIEEPVCGSNGVTYKNSCILSCIFKGNIKAVSVGPCHQFQEIIKVPQDDFPNCNCPPNGPPVYGADGKPYQNICFLKCDQIPEKNNLQCRCPNLQQQVCGSDGITYDNECLLRCTQNAYVVGSGVCEIFENNLQTCDCSNNDKKQVCGANGKTYLNLCFLNCQQTLFPHLKILSDEACLAERNESTKILAAPSLLIKECGCINIEEPICGSDQKTYSNECYLQCRKEFDRNLELLHPKACTKVDKIKKRISFFGSITRLVSKMFGKNCNCPNITEPVCGSDNNTYSNKCFLECMKAEYENLTLANVGSCETTLETADKGNEQPQLRKVPKVFNEIRCVCSLILASICGSDGVTYKNFCIMDCHRKKVEDLNAVAIGPCDNSLKI